MFEIWMVHYLVASLELPNALFVLLQDFTSVHVKILLLLHLNNSIYGVLC
jgi:hypothetical protein